MELCFNHAGINIHTRIDGEGIPIMLLHSYWGSSALFDPLVSHLVQRQFKIIRIDFPGHGNSSSPTGPYTFNELSASVSFVLQQIGIDKPLPVIGHSMGGYLAMAFTKNYPQKVKALVLMHSPLCKADDQSIKLREREAAFLKKGKKELLLRTTLPTNFAPGNETRFAEAFGQLSRISRQVTLEGALAAIHAINHREDFREYFKSTELPLLIIIGQHDRVYDAAMMRAEAVAIPASQHIILCQSGHLGFIEESGEVTWALITFLCTYA